MYSELLIRPMREELVRLGAQELRTPDEVDAVLPLPGTTMVVVNSICGCAARNARPAVRLALERTRKRPDRIATVFAGQDREATARAREYFTGYPPSSPAVALLRDGQLVFMLERKDIEGRDAESIAADLVAALERFC